MNSHTNLAVLIRALLLITACGESGNRNTGNGDVTNNNQRNFR